MLLKVKDLAAWLNMPQSTVYLWAAQGKIPCQKVHGLIRFERAEVQHWLDSFATKPSNPVSHIPGRDPSLPVCCVSMEKENNTRVRWLTVEEEQRLLAAAAPWLRELVVLAIYTGMRMGEILALTWAGVDLFRRTVTVFRSKNGERRTIPLNTTVLDLLKGKYATRAKTIDIVFHSESCTPLDGSNIRRALTTTLDIAKIQDLHLHDLRHTFATSMVQAGIDLYKVQWLLGHKSLIMTQRCTQHYPESLREGVDSLEAGRSVSTNLVHSQVRSCDASLRH